MTALTPLVDGFGRVHTDLRVSVTDRCNLRCTYCMPLNVVFKPRAELLTFEEITRVARVAATLGIRSIRLTGGEPLLRRDLSELVRQPTAVPGIEEVALTTNGLLPAELDYSRILLTYEGAALAVLAQADGGAVWPRLLDPTFNSQCGCCKLCFAQNAAALADTTVSRGAAALAGPCRRQSQGGFGGAQGG